MTLEEEIYVSNQFNREEGREEERIKLVMALMESTGVDIGKAIDMLKIAENERPSIIEAVNSKG